MTKDLSGDRNILDTLSLPNNKSYVLWKGAGGFVGLGISSLLFADDMILSVLPSSSHWVGFVPSEKRGVPTMG